MLYEKMIRKDWYLVVSFKASFRELCIQPIHICIDPEWKDYVLQVGLLFFRFSITLSGEVE